MRLSSYLPIILAATVSGACSSPELRDEPQQPRPLTIEQECWKQSHDLECGDLGHYKNQVYANRHDVHWNIEAVYERNREACLEGWSLQQREQAAAITLRESCLAQCERVAEIQKGISPSEAKPLCEKECPPVSGLQEPTCVQRYKKPELSRKSSYDRKLNRQNKFLHCGEATLRQILREVRQGTRTHWKHTEYEICKQCGEPPEITKDDFD